MNEVTASNNNSASSSTSGSASAPTDEQPPTKKMKVVPNIAEELAKNRSPPLSNSHNNAKKQISISSLLSDPQPPKPVIRAPTIILPSQRPGTSNIEETDTNDILIARTKSPVSVLLDRPQSNAQISTDSQDRGLTKPVTSIDALLKNGSETNTAPETDSTSAASKVNGDSIKTEPVSGAPLATKDQKSKGKTKDETNNKVPKTTAKNSKSAASKSGKNSKAATAKNKKEPVKKDSRTKQDNKNKQDNKPKSESSTPGSTIATLSNNTPEVSAFNEAKVKPEQTELETGDNKEDAKKDKSKKKKVETPRKLVPAPSIKSPKVTSMEVNGKPIVVLDIPLHDVSSNDYLDENGQVVFNVYNLIQEKYGSQLNKAKRNLMVDLNDDVEAAEDNEGEEAADIEHGGEDDDDDDDDDDEEEEDDVGASDLSKNKDTSVSPKKKRPHPLKGKSRIGKYDIEDPFIDDSELLWEEQRAATRDGFFVYFGPLIEKGQYASFQRVDGTMKKGGIKNPK